MTKPTEQARELLAKLHNQDYRLNVELVTQALQAVRDEERERCAGIAEQHAAENGPTGTHTEGGNRIADKILAQAMSPEGQPAKRNIINAEDARFLRSFKPVADVSPGPIRPADASGKPVETDTSEYERGVLDALETVKHYSKESVCGDECLTRTVVSDIKHDILALLHDSPERKSQLVHRLPDDYVTRSFNNWACGATAFSHESSSADLSKVTCPDCRAKPTGDGSET